jgi:hypothetical protein
MGVSFQSFTCGYPVVPTLLFIEEALFSPMYVFGAFVKNHVVQIYNITTCGTGTKKKPSRKKLMS